MQNDVSLSARVPLWLKQAIEQQARQQSHHGQTVTAAAVVRAALWRQFAAHEPAATAEPPAPHEVVPADACAVAD